MAALGVRPDYRLAHSDRPDPDLTASLYARTPAALLGHTLGAVAVITLCRGSAPRWLLLGWLLMFAAAWGARVAVARRYAASRPASTEAYRRWQQAWDITSLACGAVWALAVVAFYDNGHSLQSTALILLVYSYCIGSPATSYRVFVVYLLMCFVPMVVHVVADGLPDSLPMAGLIVGGLLVTLVIGRQYRQAFGELLALKVGNEQLADQLAIEKAAAEQARAAAEEANRAKTRFFAAASHDLRQPLHALSLFTETLRQRACEDETALLAGRIAESVAALESLFGELMDLSRLDAGGVELAVQDFPIAEVYARLRLHFEPLAFDKGLALRFRGSAHWVHGDAVLVERVLRNLVSNAVRYTEDGGVLVGCRRRGDRLLLQVWDSGIGIPVEAQAHVFDEFYQVVHTHALAAPRRGGSGLGLAIVRRLAQLMGAPIDLASQPQRGTVVTLTLPVGQPRSREVEPADGLATPVRTLSGCRIVVVEDDVAVREAMCVLLLSWEAEVVGLDSLVQVDGWLAARPQGAPVPELLIVDRQLPMGHSGAEVVQRLRAAFGAELGVIMVTGQVDAQDEAMAQALGCHLLYKPVAANRLRALIGYKRSERQRPT
jgi:signal transduction histidine kinase